MEPIYTAEKITAKSSHTVSVVGADCGREMEFVWFVMAKLTV
jgi:hypothetical protein